MGFFDALFTFLHDNKGLPFRSMTVFNFLLEASLCGALLILLALLVRWLLRRKLGSRAVYMVWLLVAIRLLVPLALPNPLMNDLRPTLSTDVGARPIADQIRVRFQDATSDLSRLIDPERQWGNEATVASKLSKLVLDISAYTSYGWTGKWFLFGYLAVDGIILCCMIGQNIRFRRRLQKRRVGMLTGELAEKYRALCATCKMKPLPVYYVESLQGACMVGVFKPYIALPATLAEPTLALMHELCHYRAHDEWWGVLRSLCCIAHWFNPLVWIGAHCARADSEFAVDERVTQLITGEQQTVYRDELVSRTAPKSMPGILVLSTEMVMRNRRLERRKASTLERQKRSGWGTAAFAVLCIAVLIGSFCTAESRSGDDNLSLKKSIYAYQLDNPYPEVDEYYQRVRVTLKPIASNAEAIQQAMLYMDTDFLGNAAQGRTDLRYSVYHAAEGWYVTATASFDELYSFLLGDDGKILRYNGRVFENEVLVNNGRLPENIDTAMAGYMNAFAVDCLGQPSAGNPAINEDQYNNEGRYLACQADIGGETCGFLIRVAPYPQLLQFFTPVKTATAFTQENVLYSLWVYLRDELGITVPERREGCQFAVEWQENTARWVGTVRIQAEAVSEASLAKLQTLCGDRTVYTLQVECGVDGSGSDTVTAMPVSESSDASVSSTTKTTLTYYDVNGQLLYAEETVPAGMPYTVLRTVTPEDSRFEQVWAKGHTWLMIRYLSPVYGSEITRWMLSPEEKIALEPGVGLDSDGRPRGWRSNVLPDTFWDTMEQMGGGDWATASVLLEKWQEKYDESSTSWPLEGQALWELWMTGIENSSQICGLPEPGDVSMGKAVEIANDTFRKEWAKTYPEQVMPANLTRMISFLYNVDQGNQRIWYVQYLDLSKETGQFCGDVTMDAQTGEVLSGEALIGGNG